MSARKPVGKFKPFYTGELGQPGATGLALGLFWNATEDSHSQNTLLSAFLRENKIKVFLWKTDIRSTFTGHDRAIT